MKQKNSSGFTLVEVVIVIVIIAILAAIIVPITLGIIDDSKDEDAKLTAKNIMTAVQSEFNNLAANDELWYSISGEIGIILNKNRKNYGKTEYKDSTEFKDGFININNTVAVQNILKKIDNADEIEALYVGAGDAYKYYMDDDKVKMYTAYVIIFKMKGDDQPVYFYDGKEISKSWPFSSPAINKMSSHKGTDFKLSRYGDINIQLYALKPGGTSNDCCNYWRNTLMPIIDKQNK